MIFNLICLVLSVGGLYVSYRIYKEKHSGKPITCPLNGRCEIVLHSKYSKIAGIGLEYFGLLFYGILFIGNIFILFPVLFSAQINIFLFIFSSFGILFTIYLIFIQKFILKSWCTWCLFSSITTLLIFVTLLIIVLGKNFDSTLIIDSANLSQIQNINLKEF